MAACSNARSGRARRFVIGFLVVVGLLVPAGAVPRPELLPRGRCRADHRCTSARPSARASSRHRAQFDRIQQPRPRRSSRPKSWCRSSTISACRSAASTRSTTIAGTIGPQDGDILIAADEGSRADRRLCPQTLREELPKAFPGTTFSFLPADITSQILNFGAPAPIDVQVAGGRNAGSQFCLSRARSCAGSRRSRAWPMRVSSKRALSADARRRRSQPDQPVRPHRARRDQRPVRLRSPDGPRPSPVFFLNPENGVSYPVVAQTPEYQVGSLSDLQNIPMTGQRAIADRRCLAASRTVPRGNCGGSGLHYNIAAVDRHLRDALRAATSVPSPATSAACDQGHWRHSAKGRDGHPARPVCDDEYRLLRPRATAFSRAIVLIYLLIVVNFQSWLDPFVIITAAARRDRRHHLDAVHHRHHPVGAGAHRRDHVHGRGDGELDPGGQLRPRTAGRTRRVRREAALEAGMRALPPGADDRARRWSSAWCRWRSAWAKAASRMRRSAAP